MQEHDRAISLRIKRSRRTAQQDKRELSLFLDSIRRKQFAAPHLRNGIACVRKLRFVTGESAFNCADEEKRPADGNRQGA